MNFLHILRRFVFIFLASLCWIYLGVESSASQYQESGLPYIQTCLPGTYTYVNHFNSIVQGKNGFIYIGARNGILRFNGQSWKQIPTDGDVRLIRQMDNIVAYTKNQLFIIESSLRDEFVIADSINPSGENKVQLAGNILQVSSHNENLYILTSAGLYLNSGGSLSEIKTDKPVRRIFPSGEGVILLTETNQIFQHTGHEIQSLEFPLESGLPGDLLSFGDKTLFINEEADKLIIINQADTLDLPEEASSFIKVYGYTSAAWLKNGQLALGTQEGGLVIVDSDGKVIRRISLADGLYSKEVRGLLADEANNLWVLHDQALCRIEFPFPFTSFKPENGLRGNTKDILRHEGKLYAATSEGLFLLHPADDPYLPVSTIPAFQKIIGIDEECSCLESIPGSILAGTRTGLFEIRGGNIRMVFQDPVISLLYIPEQKILLAGTEAGIRIFNLADWSEIKNFSLPKISIDHIELSPGNFLWLSSRAGTMYRSNKPFNNPTNLICKSITAVQLNSPPGSFTGLIRTSQNLWFSTINGLLKYDPASDSFYPDTIVAFPFEKGTYRVSFMKEDNEKNLWINVKHLDNRFDDKNLSRQRSGGKFEIRPLPYRRLDDMIINCLYPEPDGILWIGTHRGIFRYDPGNEIESSQTSRTYISNILVGDNKMSLKNEHGDLPVKPRPVKIPHSKNRLRFEFNSTGFICESAPLYQYRLVGLNDDWSAWGTQRVVQFAGLNRGRYEFQVRSQDIYGILTEADAFTFRIRASPPAAWYALLFYSLVILVLIWLIQKWKNLQHIKGQFHLEEVVQERTESLIKEKEKAEDLLANILPKTTADELKAGGKASTSKFKMCTVLFADIQGFTKIAEEMNPDKLIDQLDKFYYQFDSVVEKYNIEKIKTIGDAYMAAGGIPVKNRTNPVDVVLAALEMQQFMKKLKESQSDIWDLRIGIHTGSVIAGVVGQKKYSYDIWGDTVNTASRMESSGEIGKVNISATTYKLIKDFFQCEFRGKMPVKYKGDIAMFFVNGLNPTFSEADKITPNEKFNVQIQLLRLLDLEELVIEKLKKELPEDLFFHNVEHTSHVYSQVELLGRGEKVSDEDLLLLQTAALLHDVGYIEDMEGHEERSVKFAREILPVYRYKEDQIEKICRLILATSLPPKPENLLEQIICDANLDHLGRVDFLIQSDKLFQEYRMRNKIKSKKDWNQYQIDFLQTHEFYTDIANRMREVSRDQQVENIRQFS